MKQEKVEAFVKQLQNEKKRLMEEIDALEEGGLGDTLSYSVGELSVYDNHPADIGDELFERSKDVALRDNAHVLLEKVEAALAKADNGTYGVCEGCGEHIPLERLEAMPSAALCIQCQQAADDVRPMPRPLEEAILEPPFQRTFMDQSETESVGFDGEDALQAVLKFGSSDSPQDIPGSYDYKALFPNSNEHQGIVEKTDAIPQNTNAVENKTER